MGMICQTQFRSQPSHQRHLESDLSWLILTRLATTLSGGRAWINCQASCDTAYPHVTVSLRLIRACFPFIGQDEIIGFARLVSTTPPMGE